MPQYFLFILDAETKVVPEPANKSKTKSPSFEDAVHQHANEVKLMLGREIVQRYYFQRGTIHQALKDDKMLKAAIDNINTELY